MIPTTEETAAYLDWLDRRNPGFGSALALTFKNQLHDMGWIKEPEMKKKPRPFLPENRQTSML